MWAVFSLESRQLEEGIIDEIGGLKDAMKKLYEMVDRESNK